VLLGFVAAFLLLRQTALTRRLLVRGALALTLLVVALAPLLWPYVIHHRELGFERDVGEAEWYGMDLLSILDPGVFNAIYRHHLVHLGHAEGGLFPGFVALGLATLALWTLAPAQTPKFPRWIGPAQRAVAAGAGLCLLSAAIVAVAGGIAWRLGPVRLLRIDNLTVVVNLLPALALAAVWKVAAAGTVRSSRASGC
jgi:hypothetical protein